MAIDITEHRDGNAVRRILEALPEWFGIPEAIDGYAADAADDSYGSLMALDDGAPVGVVPTRRHFPESAEIHLMAVHPDVRGTGIGRRLVERVVDDLSADGCTLLSVHTVGPSFENAPPCPDPGLLHQDGFPSPGGAREPRMAGRAPRSSWSAPWRRPIKATQRASRWGGVVDRRASRRRTPRGVGRPGD